MKKILLVGQMNQSIENLNKSLTENFEVQLCSASVELIKGMAKISHPDLVILCLAGLTNLDNTIPDYFRSFQKELPVLIIGAGEECRRYKNYYDNKQFFFLVRPITQPTLIMKCNEILEVEEEEPKTQPQIAPKPVMPVTEKKLIMVVDDSSLSLRSIKAMLDQEYNVIVAMDGQKAIATIRNKKPDLILLDYEMPGWDGRRTLEAIRNDENIKDIPVMFLTGVKDKEHIAAVLKLNPAGYFLKPPEKDRIIEAIRKIFSDK
ncbi:MAG: PleD family two-component system response regulator [Lachnospiraceae bacterium]